MSINTDFKKLYFYHSLPIKVIVIFVINIPSLLEQYFKIPLPQILIVFLLTKFLITQARTASEGDEKMAEASKTLTLSAWKYFHYFDLVGQSDKNITVNCAQVRNYLKHNFQSLEAPVKATRQHIIYSESPLRPDHCC